MISFTIIPIISIVSFIHLIRRTDCVGCQFPLEIRGDWSRSRDAATLAFSESQVSGLSISWNSQKMNQFNCHTESAGNYIINSSFASTLGNLDFYVCWTFIKITPAAFILYELSDLTNITGFDATTLGHVQPPGILLEPDKVCTRKTYFTTLVKKGAASSEVASSCPSQLNATFTYSTCPTTQLDFCPDGRVGVVDYSLCPTQIFQSASGVITCMGHVSVGQDIFINLLTSGKVVCFKIPDKVVGTSFSGLYYSGDCSTVTSGSSSPITLTQKSLCIASTTTSTTESTTTYKQPATAADTTVTTGLPDSNAVTRVVESKGDDTVTVGVAVGLSVGLFALILLAVLLLVLVWRQKIKMKVSDFFQGRETKSAPIEEQGQGKIDTTRPDAKEENLNVSEAALTDLQGENENSARVSDTDLRDQEKATENMTEIYENKSQDVKTNENGLGHLNGVAVIQGAKPPGQRLPATKKKIPKDSQSKKKKLGKIKIPAKVHNKK